MRLYGFFFKYSVFYPTDCHRISTPEICQYGTLFTFMTKALPMWQIIIFGTTCASVYHEKREKRKKKGGGYDTDKTISDVERTP
jgi:hypothetical protein